MDSLCVELNRDGHGERLELVDESPDHGGALVLRGRPRKLLGGSTSLGRITEKNGCPILSVRRATVCTVSVSAT